MTSITPQERGACGIWHTAHRLVAVITDQPPIAIAHTQKAYGQFIDRLVTRRINAVVMTEEYARMNTLSRLVSTRGLPIIIVPAVFIDNLCTLAAWKRCPPKKKAAILARLPSLPSMMDLIRRATTPYQLTLDL